MIDHTDHEMFFNTSIAIKRHSTKIQVGGLSSSPAQASILVEMQKGHPERAGAFDLFTYHAYCNGKTAAECAAMQVGTVAELKKVLPGVCVCVCVCH